MISNMRNYENEIVDRLIKDGKQDRVYAGVQDRVHDGVQDRVHDDSRITNRITECTRSKNQRYYSDK